MLPSSGDPLIDVQVGQALLKQRRSSMLSQVVVLMPTNGRFHMRLTISLEWHIVTTTICVKLESP